MNSLALVIISIVIFLIAYVTYGSWLAKKWGLDPARKTPAHSMGDGVDYVPTKLPILLGHHFASIAGAGPIIGPIAAAFFGWVPVVLWILVGTIFIGGVQDFGSLFASVRHAGKSIGDVIGVNIGEQGKKLFATFAWLTLLLVIAAFVNIVASTFVAHPQAATACIMFILLALVFGFAVYRRGVPVGIATTLAIIALAASVAIGHMFPLSLSREAWMIILLAYIFISSVTPVWILLQPRDYLNSFLLYAMMAGAVLGLIFTRPDLQMPAFVGFNVGGTFLFPMLFVIVACGAISGFHSLVSSGTTAKQVDVENDTKLIGYGGMLIEGTLAIVAIITAAYITGGRLSELMDAGGPINVFSQGVGYFMTGFGIPLALGVTFVALAISEFALTTLDTATRLGRFVLQEYFIKSSEKAHAQGSILTNRFFASGVTVVLSGILALGGWRAVWPIFGSANQLLAALSLLAIAMWLRNIGRNYKMIIAPILFMFAVTLSALILLIQANIAVGNYILVVPSVLLFLLALGLIYQTYLVISKPPQKPSIEA